MEYTGTTPASAPVSLNRPLAFAMASASVLFFAFVGLFGQLATREFSLLTALFLRFFASVLVTLAILRGEAWRTLAKIRRLDLLRVGAVLISQFCLYNLKDGSLLVGMLLYNIDRCLFPFLRAYCLGSPSESAPSRALFWALLA
jgi:hypothetical protein